MLVSSIAWPSLPRVIFFWPQPSEPARTKVQKATSLTNRIVIRSLAHEAPTPLSETIARGLRVSGPALLLELSRKVGPLRGLEPLVERGVVEGGDLVEGASRLATGTIEDVLCREATEYRDLAFP